MARPPHPRAGRPPAPERRQPRPRREHEERLERVHGLKAALAVFARRPQAIRAISHTAEVRRVLAPLLRDAAARRIPYREVPPEDLARIAGSEHHEGVFLLAEPRTAATLADLATRLRETGGLAVALDQVENPHNLGAIARSAAYFGAAGLLLRGQPPGPSAARVAQGGMEHLLVVAVPSLEAALAELRARGIAPIGADLRAPPAALELAWPHPCVLVLGNERGGLSAEVREACERLVSIPGAGQVESLNVSVAAGILLALASRRR